MVAARSPLRALACDHRQKGSSAIHRPAGRNFSCHAWRRRYFPPGNYRCVTAFPAAGHRHIGGRAFRAEPQSVALLRCNGRAGIGDRLLHHGLDRTKRRRKRARKATLEAASAIFSEARPGQLRCCIGGRVSGATRSSPFHARDPGRRGSEISESEITRDRRRLPVCPIQRGRATRHPLRAGYSANGEFPSRPACHHRSHRDFAHR